MEHSTVLSRLDDVRADLASAEQHTSPQSHVTDRFEGLHAEFMEFYAFYLKYSYRSEDVPWGVLMIVLFVFMISLCVLMNTLVFTFYKTKANEIVAFVYTILSFSDILVAFGGCFTATTLVIYLSMNLRTARMSYVNKALEMMCYATFFLSAITIRMSILLSTILTLVRTIMICNPFTAFKKEAIYVLILVVAAIWVFLISGEIYVTHEIIEAEWAKFLQNLPNFDEEDMKNRKQILYMWYFIFTSLAGNYHFIHFLGDTLPYSVGLHGDTVPDSYHIEELAEKVCGYVMFSITFIIPSIIAIVCLIIQAFALHKSAISGVNNRNKDVTYTIILLTVVFLLCNSATVIFCSLAAYTSIFALEDEAVKDDREIMTFYRLTFVFQQLLPLVNSTLSPLILICRGEALKTFVKEVAREVRGIPPSATVAGSASNFMEAKM